MTVDFERVEARGLVKLYGSTRALAGVDQVFERGKITAVEGPNGSGKSTLLTILAQLARPTRGEVRYGDLDGRRGGAELRRRIGVLGHAAMVYPDMTGRENLALFAELYGVGPAGVDAAIARFDLTGFVDRPARTYSRGQLQRLALARTLLPEPRLLLLDEPSTGLDARSTERLVTAMKEERARGTILVLVTHDDSLSRALADERVRLERGRVATREAS